MKEEKKQGQFFALDHLLWEHWQSGNEMLSQLWQWFSSRINANHKYGYIQMQVMMPGFAFIHEWRTTTNHGDYVACDA